MPPPPDPPAADEEPLAAALRAAGWRVDGVLGQGATSTVYAARATAGGPERALKVQRLPGEAVAARILREGRVQQQLDHPGLLRVHGVLELAGRVALVMDRVHGGTLEERVAAEGPLDPQGAGALLLPVLQGLEHTHRLGVVHRDVKPANVLVEADGSRARLADFGIARLVGEAPDAAATQVGVPMGTPGYMAPEQWADASTAGIPADVFAAGALTWFVLVGRSPFAGPDPTAVLRATLEGRRQDLRALAPACPPALAAVVSACLAPDPAGRPASLEALIAALPAPGAEASADTIVPAAAPPAALPAAAPPAALPAAAPPAALPAAAPPPARRQRLPGVAGAALSGALLGLLGWLLLRSIGVIPGPPPASPDLPPTPEAEATPPPSAVDAVASTAAEASATPAPVPGCVASEGELIGWWWAGTTLRRSLWGGVRIERDTHVRAAPPDGAGALAPVRCILPAGSRVSVRADPLEVRGELWVPLYGGDLRRR